MIHLSAFTSLANQLLLLAGRKRGRAGETVLVHRYGPELVSIRDISLLFILCLFSKTCARIHPISILVRKWRTGQKQTIHDEHGKNRLRISDFEKPFS